METLAVEAERFAESIRTLTRIFEEMRLQHPEWFDHRGMLRDDL